MKISFLFASLILILSNAFAQNAGKISGSILKNGQPADGATVSLLRARDSSLVKIAVVNKNGFYSFENLAIGKYLVGATVAGYQKHLSAIIEVGKDSEAIQIPSISLIAINKELLGVTVIAKRPLIEQRIDRTIVNVDASITNIGRSALEVLEKSPGVTVDRDGNISLKGKDGVLVMVDGRPTHLNGTDLANLLRTMNSSQLDQIEIMTNPPARYDAAGNAGVINIKMKKTTTVGTNGSATLGYTQGRYAKTNEAFNFNYRENKINLFANLGHNYRKSFSILNIQRKLFDPATNELQNYFDQQADMINEGNSFNAKLGVDFFATKRTTFGIILNGTTSPSSSNNSNTSYISNASKVVDGITTATVDNTTQWKNVSTNFNFRTLLDKKGKELSSDIDLLRYTSGTEQFMVNSYRDATGSAVMNADSLIGDLPQNIKVYSGRIDYVQPLNKKTRFEAGIKTGVVKTDNNAVYDSIQNGSVVRDVNRSNHFVYEENINAAYANVSTGLSKKWSAQLGLRLENTIAKGDQLTTGEKFTRNYTQLYPTAYLQFKANDKNMFAANVGRRVRRPNYGSLNPFMRFIDRYTYTMGNPALKPSLSNNFELSHTWRNQVTTTLNYTSTTDIIEEVIEQKGQEAYKTPSNIASLHQYGIAISANTPITKWWTSSININAFNNRYKGIVSGSAVELSTLSYIVTGTQQFKLTNSMIAEVNGRFRNGWLEGVMKAKAVGFVGAGISQQMMKGKGMIRLSVRDIFYSQKLRGESKYGNVDFNFQQATESRVVSVGFTYRFSKGKKIAPTKRTTGSANEEQERISQ
jgi:iron complex outermembrane receptor protein